MTMLQWLANYSVKDSLFYNMVNFHLTLSVCMLLFQDRNVMLAASKAMQYNLM